VSADGVATKGATNPPSPCGFRRAGDTNNSANNGHGRATNNTNNSANNGHSQTTNETNNGTNKAPSSRRAAIWEGGRREQEVTEEGLLPLLSVLSSASFVASLRSAP